MYLKLLRLFFKDYKDKTVGESSAIDEKKSNLAENKIQFDQIPLH